MLAGRQRTRRKAAGVGLAALLIAAAGLIGCGSDDGDGDGSAARPAPEASLFPSAKGKSLEQVLSETDGEAEVVVSPAGRVLRLGENRFGFGLFTPAREQIADAEIAIYAAPKNLQGPAIGPFPARIEDLSTEPVFRAQTTADDPDAATVVYVSEVELDRPGEWVFGAVLRQGDSLGATLVATPSLVGQYDDVLNVGDPAPRVSTPTADDVADISEIDTRVPPGTMHDDDLADVLGREPVVLLFATPQLCQSRVCGPVVDVAEQVKRDFGDQAAFIHMEIYEENDPSPCFKDGVLASPRCYRPQFLAFNLPTEPWLFVIDRKGVIRTAIEGAFSVAELERAVRQVAS